jgi:hypothetical protein
MSVRPDLWEATLATLFDVASPARTSPRSTSSAIRSSTRSNLCRKVAIEATDLSAVAAAAIQAGTRD